MPVSLADCHQMDDINLPSQIPVDDGYGELLELDRDDVNSAFSIASTKWNFTWEHGRLYQDYRSGYTFPLDEVSQENEKIFHAMMLCILDNKPFVAPVVGENLKNVLDVGTGLGLWAQDVADAFPNAHVLGLDTVPTASTIPNLEFQVADITQDWIFDDLNIRFDLVHLRNLFATLSNNDWSKLYQQCYDYMKPGAWIEQIEVEIIARCDDNTKKPDSEIYKLAKFADDLSAAVKLNFRIAEEMADMMRQAGFVDIKEGQYKLPLGWWSADPKYREIGKFYELFYKTGLQGWLLAGMTRYMNRTPQEVNEMCMRAVDEIDSRQHHYYFYLRVVVARRP